MRIVSTALVTVLLFAAGCRTTILGPVASLPEHNISVTIDSIPSGANVYAIEKDGQLGAKIGTTPLVHRCGVARRYMLWTDTKERASVAGTLGWGLGAQWKVVDGRIVFLLNIALAKGDHSIAVASKEIFHGTHGASRGEEFRDKNIALTVPLKTLPQVNREVEIYLRQQGLNRQQNITIKQQKDGLDSINSGLDALIKLHGLGAFNR